MAGGFSTTNADDLMQIALVEAQMTINQGFNLRDYITRRPIVNGKVVRFPKYAALTASALTEGTAVSSVSDVTTTSVDVTAAEVGVMTTISDLVTIGHSQAASDAGKLMGNAIRAKMNQDIFALFDGFSQVVGDGSKTIEEANLAEAYYMLLAANAPGPYFVAVTPKVYSDLLKLYSSNTNITANGFKDAALGAGVVPDIFGMKVLQITDLTSTVATGTTAKCGVFSAAALGFADGWDIRIEAERSGRLRGWYLTGTACYGVAEIEDTFGVELNVVNVPAAG